MKSLLSIAIILTVLILSACASKNAGQIGEQNIQYTPAVRQTSDSNVLIPPVVAPSTGTLATSPVMQSNLIKTTSKPVIKGQQAIRSSNQKAIQTPNSASYMNAIMAFNYEAGALYKIYSSPLNVTDVEFEPGEKIISVAAGDTMRWQVSKTYSGEGEGLLQHLLIKPNEPDIENNIVVMTNRRTYHLLLHSAKDTYMAVVKWNYPRSQNSFVEAYGKDPSSNLSLPGSGIGQFNFNYKITLMRGEKPEWMPETVFNDGKHTYIKFSSVLREAPLLLIGQNWHTDQIVNYRVIGQYYVIDQVVTNAELSLGTPPTVVNITLNKKGG